MSWPALLRRTFGIDVLAYRTPGCAGRLRVISEITSRPKPAHGFQYTPVDLETSDDPPDLGIANVSTTYQYNLHKQLELVSRPDGKSIDPTAPWSGGTLGSTR